MIQSKSTRNTEKVGLSAVDTGGALLPEEPDIQRSIEITIESIENTSSLVKIIGKSDTGILIRVQHNDVTLGESSSIDLCNEEVESGIINVDYVVLFAIAVNKQSSIGAAVSAPILITAIETPVEKPGKGITSPETGSAGDIGSKNKGKRNSALKVKSAKGNNQDPSILGMCNFDLMPIFLGEKIVREKVVVEAPSQAEDEGVINFRENVPRLIITAKLLDADLFPQDMDANFLTITVESIYNVPSSWTDDMDYKASTVIPAEDNNYQNSQPNWNYAGEYYVIVSFTIRKLVDAIFNPFEWKLKQEILLSVPEDVVFGGSVKTSVPDTERTKCWHSLSHLKGRAKLSKYKLNNDISKSDVNNELAMKLLDNAPRVQWNSMLRSMVSHSRCQAILNILKRYKNWPFFFSASRKARDVDKQKGKETDSQLLFQCYADVSELLYPGTTRIRTLAQLHSFNLSAMAERTGLDKSVFGKETPKEPAMKEKESKKGKSSTKGSSVPTTAAVSIEPEIAPSLPLTSEDGQPVFVIIEIELFRPLQPARTLEDLTNRIDRMVHSYVLPPNPYTSELAEEHYSNCIRKLTDTLCAAYQDFVDNRSTPDTSERRHRKVSSGVKKLSLDEDSGFVERSCKETVQTGEEGCKYSYIKDEVECFMQYLHETGLYLSVRSTLKNKITLLLDQKFKIQMHTLSKKESQNFVATTYVHLVERMHCALNKIVEGQYARGFRDSSTVGNLSFFAEESFALGYNDDARREYSDMISEDPKNPDAWIEYAIFLIRVKDVDRATECSREAIALNKKHKVALLLYGLILAQKEQYCEAEIFLQTVTRIYPRFAEAWGILHLFYLRTQNFPGADATIQVARECLKDKAPDTVPMPLLVREPLLWSTFNYPKDRIYLVTAVFLLKLSCLDFSGIALAQELAEMGRTRHVLYYIAVQHYFDCRYEDAICHLKEVVNIHGMEYSVASLMGHCHLEEGSFDEAEYCYEFANCSFDRPEDLHLVQIRLGYLYLSTERYENAKKLFLIVSRNSPTSRSWLGAGIAYYHLGDMKNAEKSLKEANYLNTQSAEVWGYLCLVNMSLQRYDEFLHCYQQVVKNNLTNVMLWTMIKDLMKSLGYSTPVLSIDSGGSLMDESLENEGDFEAYHVDDNK